MFNGGRVESQALLAWEVGIIKDVVKGRATGGDEWSNKMLTEAVDMTIWLAESVDWLSHVRGEWRRRLQEWNGDVLYECSTLLRSRKRLSK
jgi:hypothetical protein